MCLCVYHQCGGIERIVNILCAMGRPVTCTSERVRSEAAGVIAQLTSPSLVISPQVHELRHSSLFTNMADLVPALTGRISSSSSSWHSGCSDSNSSGSCCCSQASAF